MPVLRPCLRKALLICLIVSARGSVWKGHGFDVILYSVVAVFHMQKPSWCFDMLNTYFTPASFAAAAHLSGSNFVGLNVVIRFSYACM